MPVTGWMLLRVGALLAAGAALLMVLAWDWPPPAARAPLLLLLVVAWFVGRIGQWVDDASPRRLKSRSRNIP